MSPISEETCSGSNMRFFTKGELLCERSLDRTQPLLLPGPGRLFWICRRTDEHTRAWSDAAHLDHDRLAHFDEMDEVCGLRVEASDWQRLQRRRIEFLAVASVPSAGKNRHLAV